MLQAGLRGELKHFRVAEEALPATADYVAAVIRQNYPDLKVPLHARWRHFIFNGRDLWRETADRVAWTSTAARARAELDLAIISVLLDAGAGSEWKYRDPATGLTIGRSEGLALASLRMFEAGLFSENPKDQLRADATRLAAVTEKELADGFQASAENPVPGLGSRAALLRRLGDTLLAAPEVFAQADSARPGGLFNALLATKSNSISAPDILHLVLLHLGTIWEDRLTLSGIPLGDTWRHRAIRRSDDTNGLMPIHKLSQWLSYSLVEPLQQAGLSVTDLDGLTGLAEYRNGGLLVDSGVLVLRDAEAAAKRWPVDSELVVEWRALTVALLDALLPLVRERLGVTAKQFPLGSLLEGGTWSAGRKIAREKRAGGGPPLSVISDGTVF
jgi:hypothetical protein